MNPTPAYALLGHVLERLSQVLLAEGQLAGGPDLRVLRALVSVQVGHSCSNIPASGSS